MGSKKVRSKLPAPSSVGPYLSPPDDEEQFGGYKSHKSSSSSSSPTYSSSSSSKKYYSQLSRRRPQQNEPRVDVNLDLSPSETQAEQEVNVFGPPLAGEQPRVPLKRKRIYTSTTHTAAGAASAIGHIGGTAATARVRIPISQPQTTAATSSSSSLPARTGTAAVATIGVSISAAPMPTKKQQQLFHPAQLRHLTLPSARVNSDTIQAASHNRDQDTMRPSRRRPLPLPQRSPPAQRRLYRQHSISRSNNNSRRHFHSRHM